MVPVDDLATPLKAADASFKLEDFALRIMTTLSNNDDVPLVHWNMHHEAYYITPKYPS